MSQYPEVEPNPNFPDIEETVLKYWQENKLFEASIEARPAADEFVFYDGPPFANGLPHYGHLLTGYVKDAIARYQTMNGKRVERRFGWDCHGLPAEMGAEKELGISGRGAIQEFGIKKFNEHCRTSVMKFTSDWEFYVDRQARWVDFANDYKTMDKDFMESVLWAFKQLWDKDLVYEAYRVMPYSWAAETPLSNFETKLDNSYREREDKAITVAFELDEPPKGAPKADKYYVLAWTTTPWTLPSNLALAVGSEVEYTYVCHPSEGGDPCLEACYIIGKNALPRYAKKFDLDNENLDSHLRGNDTVEGLSLVGLNYKPLFPYFENAENAFQILDGSSFVTDTDGTGIVHMAPGFGEDDFNLCQENNIGYYDAEATPPTSDNHPNPFTEVLRESNVRISSVSFNVRQFVCPVDGQGKYTDELFDIDEPPLKLAGLNVISQTEAQCEGEPYKPEQLKKYGLVNLRIINWLKMKGQLIKQEDFKHNYPHCWRTDTPLIYRAMPSWYVAVTKFKDRAVELNREINWIPNHIGPGQMEHMLNTAPDWSISRNRFWGTPIPVWRSKSGKVKVFGSIAELEEASGQKIDDLHRPYIDEIKIEEDGETYKRVEDVFDCWFESGSMPFAQVHYPFENKEWFESHFPADFITEYVGQTRGWFNTLIMLSTALFDKPPFKNCICHGVVLDSETGMKYSKRLKNYKDPKEVMDQYGADALRWLMLASPVMRGMDLSVDPEGKFIRDVVRLAIKPIWNAYNFFIMYANADGVRANEGKTDSTHMMDRYILAKCNAATQQIKDSLDAYDTPGACEAVIQFFEVLNNWYIRRSKERFWKEEKDDDKQAAYDTLYHVISTMTQAAAPLLPFTCEFIFTGLTGDESVHLADFPEVALQHEGDDRLIAQMDYAQDVCNAALAIRNKLNLRVRQPLASLTIAAKEPVDLGLLGDIIEDEVNVKSIKTSTDFDTMAKLNLRVNSKVCGKRIPANMKQVLPASKKGEWKKLDNGNVEVAGVELLPGEFDILLEPNKEYAESAQALSTNDALVILDTNVTPELEKEGYARDLVRMIQQARKDAGLHISDRIELAISGDAPLVDAANTHATYITEQTLSNGLVNEIANNDWYTVEQSVDDKPVTIALKKVA